MSNTWPGGVRRALTQAEHERWNASNYPGTLQLCCLCRQPTGRCEEDSIYVDAAPDGNSWVGPLCEECYRDLTPNEDMGQNWGA